MYPILNRSTRGKSSNARQITELLKRLFKDSQNFILIFSLLEKYLVGIVIISTYFQSVVIISGPRPARSVNPRVKCLLPCRALNGKISHAIATSYFCYFSE